MFRSEQNSADDDRTIRHLRLAIIGLICAALVLAGIATLIGMTT